LSTSQAGTPAGQDQTADVASDRADLPTADPEPRNRGSAGAQDDLTDDVEVERALLEQAVGGWRGLIDSGAPALIFVIAYVLTGQDMRPSVFAAVAAGLAIMVWRLVRRESLQQVISGFIGVAVSAWVASRTGRPQDFFLLGILTNLGYGLAMLVSLLVGWPAIGLLVGSMQGDPVGWRKIPHLRAAYRLCTWIWVGVFFGRLAFTVPLYLAGAVGPLGVAKVLLGWPPFLLAVYLCYRVLHPVLAADREARHAAQAASTHAGHAGDEPDGEVRSGQESVLAPPEAVGSALPAVIAESDAGGGQAR
jgi:hypothetical protein